MTEAAVATLPGLSAPAVTERPAGRKLLSDFMTKRTVSRLLSGAATLPLPNQGKRLSERGLDLIKAFEGCLKKRPDGTLEAYKCPAGVWTIGWGCTEGVRQGMIITRDEATAMLARELGHFEIVVGRLVTVPLTQGEFDALVSFVYNVGEGALRKSTLLARLNKGDLSAVPNQFLRWTRGGGRVLNGLVRRRKAEAALFLSGAVHSEALGEDYGPMPQAVTPETGSRVDVLKSSRTFWGTMTGFAGWVGAKAVVAFGIVSAAAEQAQSSTDGVRSMLGMLGAHAEPILIGVAVAGTLAALFARFDAAAEEKVG
ncbi:MAG: lysozyme [Hyphomicrobiaceae bacterium]